LEIILLIGIVKKNAIMMIDFALEAEARRKKCPPEKSIYQAWPVALSADHDDDPWRRCWARCRSRWNRATARKLRRPLGISIVGGLLVSQILTLYTTPGHLPLFWNRLSLRAKAWRTARAGKKNPDEDSPAPLVPAHP